MRTVRRFASSIRLRFVAGYVLLLAVALVVAIVVARQVQLARADAEFEQEQAQEVEELRALAGGIDPTTGEPFGTDVRAIFDTFLSRSVPSDDEAFYTIVDGRPYDTSTGAPPLLEDPLFARAWQVDGPTKSTLRSGLPGVGEVRALAVPVGSAEGPVGVFVVASFPADDYREVDDVVRLITYVGIAAVLVTSALAWTLAGRVLRPVRHLTSTARRISDSDLSARIPVDGHDELAELGTTFNDMVERLDRSFTSQRQFLDDVAHELRTPITIARGHLETLEDDPIERAHTVELVTDELDRMGRYVSDLLTLAKAVQPDFLLLRDIDPGELALDLHHRMRGLGARTWVLDAAPPVGDLVVRADPDRLAQAVLNLATNAVQHTQPGDEIGTGVAIVGPQLHLWVRDTGPGVEPRAMATLFDRYARAATSRSRRPEGSGLGLSIVDAIARAHGGRVSVLSRPGQGATSTVAIAMEAMRAQRTDQPGGALGALPAPTPFSRPGGPG
ncbi:MAG: sensor histidine kinase [Ilumatobacteraceae bacterium]